MNVFFKISLSSSESDSCVLEVEVQEDTTNKMKSNQVCEERRQILQRLTWNLEQTQSYYNFLKKNKQMFSCYQKRRYYKVYCLLNKEIASRSVNQIKSHHQKMLKRHKTIDSVMKYLRQRLQKLRARRQKQNKQNPNIPPAIPTKQDPGRPKVQGVQVDPLQLGIANNFKCRIPVKKEQWFGDL